jgi:hypothetical protein
MLSHRSAHYWLWFLLFGVVSVAVGLVNGQTIPAEALWLLGTGLLGVAFGAGSFAGRFARVYDLVVGLLFSVAGLIGVLHTLGVTFVTANAALPGGTADNTTLVGLSLSLPYALIHSVLGLTSLNLGMRASSDVPVMVAPVASQD